MALTDFTAAVIRQRWVNVAREHAHVNGLTATDATTMRRTELEMLSDELLDQWLQLQAAP